PGRTIGGVAQGARGTPAEHREEFAFSRSESTARTFVVITFDLAFTAPAGAASDLIRLIVHPTAPVIARDHRASEVALRDENGHQPRGSRFCASAPGTRPAISRRSSTETSAGTCPSDPIRAT